MVYTPRNTDINWMTHYMSTLGRHDRGLLNWPEPWKSAKDRMTAHHLMARNIDYYLFGNRRYRSDLKWYRIY